MILLERKLSALTGLSQLSEDLPLYAVMTDDPMRARMLAAHFLDNAKVLFELRGMIAYSGAYKGVMLSVISAGYGESSTLLYLHDAYLLGVRRVLYMGECVSRTNHFKVRDIIVSDDGDKALILSALSVSTEFSLPLTLAGVATRDRLFLEDSKSDDKRGIVDFAAAAISAFAAMHEIAA